MPVMKEVVKVMIGEKECKKLDAVSLSNNTVKRLIADMSNDVFQQIVHQVKSSPLYSIQLDEFTDIAGFPQLSVFIRYINNATISENFLFCKVLKLHTRVKIFFNASTVSFQSFQFHGIIVLKFALMAQQRVLASDQGQ